MFGAVHILVHLTQQPVMFGVVEITVQTDLALYSGFTHPEDAQWLWHTLK
jgi:hypothetical protein